MVRPPNGAAELQCGGHAMIALGGARPEGVALSGSHSGGSQVGKRYFDDESGLEVLCSKAGAGSVAVDGRPIPVKEAKKLPSSD